MADGDKRPSEFTLDMAFQDAPEADAQQEEKGWYTVARYGIQNDHYNGLFQQWIKPIFFLVGKHWLKPWNVAAGTYTLDTDVPDWRQQPVTNWTFAVYRSLVAKLIKQQPAMEVVPPTGDSNHRAAAKVGEAILQDLHRRLRFPHKLKRAIGWILCTGNVAVDVGWDPMAGELRPRTVLVEIPDEAMPGETIDAECAADEDGEPIRKSEPGPDDQPALDGGAPYDFDAEPEMEPIGEQTLEIDSPFCYRYNPEATDIDDAEEMFIAYLWPVGRAAREFDVDKDDIKLVGTSEGDDQRQELDDMLSSITAGAPDPFNNKAERLGSSQGMAIGDRVLVIKYYRKQDAAAGFPEGRHWITAGGTKVWPKENDDEYPNAEAPLPFGFWPPRVVIGDTVIPGQPQQLGVLSQVVPLNEKYNFLDAKIGEYHTTMAMGGVIWVAPADRGITITSEPGQVKVSKAYGESGKHPIREELHALPAAVYEERALIVQNLMSIAGASQMDLSQKPEGVTAGRAFLVIQEASDASIMPTLLAIEEGLEEIGRRQLVIAQKKYTEERTIRIRGDRGRWEFKSFSSADLVEGLDVRVQTGSSFPWSKSAQLDFKLNILSTLPGLVVDAQTGKVDREALARYLESGPSGPSAFEMQDDGDLVEIDREHAMFEEYDPTDPSKSKQLPKLAVWQNPAKHLEGHFDLMKRDYGRFEKWSVAAQLAFVDHMRLTMEAVQGQVDQIAPPIPPGGGGPPPGPGGQQPPPGPAGPTAPAGAPPGPAAPPMNSGMSLTAGDRAAA